MMKKTLEKPIKKHIDVKEELPKKPEKDVEDNEDHTRWPPLFISSGDEALDNALIAVFKKADKFKKS